MGDFKIIGHSPLSIVKRDFQIIHLMSDITLSIENILDVRPKKYVGSIWSACQQ